MSELFSCAHTADIRCPYCGHYFKESWEYGNAGEDDFEVECGECERKFDVSRRIDVFYSSKTKAEQR